MKKQHHPANLFAVFVACCVSFSSTIDRCDGFSLPARHYDYGHHTIAATTSSSTARRLLTHHQRKTIANARPLQSAVSDSAVTSLLSGEEVDADGEAASSTLALDSGSVNLPARWIIQWRGEGTEGYSEALRQLEFTSAFRAEMADYIMLHHKDNAVSTVPSPDLRLYLDNIQFHFQDALTYHGPIYEEMDENEDDLLDSDGAEPIPLAQVQTYESAMQYATISLPLSLSDEEDSTSTVPLLFSNILSASSLSKVFQHTIERCSLIRNAFEIAAEGESHKQLAKTALENGSFNDKMENGANADATWSIRLRRYGPMDNDDDETGNDAKKKSKRHARYGKNARSPLRDERKAIFAMTELVEKFRGKVDLGEPECRIYLLEGLKQCCYNDAASSDCSDDGDDVNVNKSKMLLARVIAEGPKTSIYRPNTRICITTTPLCPIASFTLCNIAQLQRHQNPAILDPFAGSCATLLAAAHITSLPTSSSELVASNLQSNPGGCRSIAIEIAHDGYVNKDDIVEDFVTRSLPPPTEIICGDCLSSEVRDQARLAIGGGAFDAIVTDPPYGIREAMISNGDGDSSNSEEDTPSISPLTNLFHAMGRDHSNGTPLLKSGGRLVAFVPVRQGEILEDCLPDLNAREAAGLVMEGEGKEQVLSDILSRWLVSFVSV